MAIKSMLKRLVVRGAKLATSQAEQVRRDGRSVDILPRGRTPRDPRGGCSRQGHCLALEAAQLNRLTFRRRRRWTQ